MKYQIKEIEEGLLLTVASLNNEYNLGPLYEEIEDLIFEDIHSVIVDLTKVDYINSVGLSFLIKVLTLSRNNGGDVYVVNVSEKIQNLLILTRLKSFFSIFNSKEDAIRALNERDKSILS